MRYRDGVVGGHVPGAGADGRHQPSVAEHPGDRGGGLGQDGQAPGRQDKRLVDDVGRVADMVEEDSRRGHGIPALGRGSDRTHGLAQRDVRQHVALLVVDEVQMRSRRCHGIAGGAQEAAGDGLAGGVDVLQVEEGEVHVEAGTAPVVASCGGQRESGSQQRESQFHPMSSRRLFMSLAPRTACPMWQLLKKRNTLPDLSSNLSISDFQGFSSSSRYS